MWILKIMIVRFYQLLSAFRNPGWGAGAHPEREETIYAVTLACMLGAPQLHCSNRETSGSLASQTVIPISATLASSEI